MNIFKKQVVSLFCSLALFFMISSTSFAQERGSFQIDPLPVLLGMILAEAEFNVSETISVGPELSVLLPFFEINDFKYFGFGGGARANFYLGGGTKASSFYLSPRVGVSHLRLKSDTDKASAISFYAGALIGYRWLFTNSVIKLGTGVKTSFGGKVTLDGHDEVASFGGTFAPNLEFSYGFRF